MCFFLCNNCITGVRTFDSLNQREKQKNLLIMPSEKAYHLGKGMPAFESVSEDF